MKTRICGKCQTEKTLVSENWHRGSWGGFASLCKPCNNLHVKEWRFKNPDRAKSANKTWYADNKEKAHRSFVRRIYGISTSKYDSLFAEQNGLCAICHKQDADGRRLSVDHDHETNEVRGLLCGFCNRALGGFFDSADLLKSAIEYIERAMVILP